LVEIPPLEEILNSKPLFYTKFDPKRIVNAYSLIEDKIKHPKRVQLIGTNGKGSTGRAIAHLASRAGLKVGHFSSPHILDFKERFWIDGKEAPQGELEKANRRLYTLLGSRVAKSLSYFEYQTLLAFILFENLDFQVIEAGLGGEFDATTVANYQLNVITPIDIDHKDFLGNSVEEIARTKLRAVEERALIGKQQNSIVYDIAKQIAKERGFELYLYKELFDIDRFQEIKSLKPSYPDYLLENIYLATLALDVLEIDYQLRELKELEIFGRFYKFKENIILDVGHNPLATKAVVNSLDKRVTAIFNLLEDKDIDEILNILKNKVAEVEIIKIENQRAVESKKLKEKLSSLNIPFKEFDGKLDSSKNYLVFGSFSVVEAFLKEVGAKGISS
jgi:dihydrofolate synthase/folylpolyglutamate synthase